MLLLLLTKRLEDLCGVLLQPHKLEHGHYCKISNVRICEAAEDSRCAVAILKLRCFFDSQTHVNLEKALQLTDLVPLQSQS